MSDLATRLEAIVRADPDLMTVLEGVRDEGLNDWLIFSGAVYQSVWNHLTGRPPGHGVKDFDVGYFDARFDEPLKSRVEVRNQRRVSEWFPQKFGQDWPPVSQTAEALERFVAPAFAVGVRLEADDRLTVAAPFGLDDVFAMVIRPNPTRPIAADWDRVIEKLVARWPELKVEQGG
jgi:hypothetical protein